jgi:hypothetical protein
LRRELCDLHKRCVQVSGGAVISSLMGIANLFLLLPLVAIKGCSGGARAALAGAAALILFNLNQPVPQLRRSAKWMRAAVASLFGLANVAGLATIVLLADVLARSKRRETGSGSVTCHPSPPPLALEYGICNKLSACPGPGAARQM